MEYIRWAVRKNFGGRRAEVLVPMAVFTVIVALIAFAVHVILGVLITTVGVAFFGIVAYAFASDAYQQSYAKFREEKEHENGPKTP